MICIYCCREEVVRLAGNPTSKTSMEMEAHVFQKAKTRVSMSYWYYRKLMLGLHIATMRYESQKYPFVMADHEFDLDLMIRTRGFSHCHELLQCVTTNGMNCCPEPIRSVENHIQMRYECYECATNGIRNASWLSVNLALDQDKYVSLTLQKA